MPRRRGIEHDSTADGRLRTKHDAIATRGHKRPLEPELRVSLSGAHDPRIHGRGAVANLHARAVGNVAGELDVEPEAHRICAGLDKGVAAFGRRRRSAANATATRWPASARSTGSPCT